MSEPQRLRLMAVLAHPDDETAGMGSTFALYSRLGVRTSLIMATRGERGWMGPEEEGPGLEAMGRLRRGELESAAAILGIEDIAYLGYTDGELDRANPAEAVAKIVAHVRRLRPHVVVTFPPDGVYGHPDHVAISQLTSAALVCASDPSFLPADGQPHRTPKFYYMVDTQDLMEAYQQVVGDLSLEVDGVVRRATYWNDWAITTRLPTEPYWEIALRALLCHRSQMHSFGDVERIAQPLLRRMLGGGTFYRAYSLVNGGRDVEDDLFAGLR